MNQALFPASTSFAPRHRSARAAWMEHEESARQKRLWSLLALFSLYAAALLGLVMVSDGADVGCILGGIAGHVLYATHRIASAWRDAATLEDAKLRAVARMGIRHSSRSSR